MAVITTGCCRTRSKAQASVPYEGVACKPACTVAASTTPTWQHTVHAYAEQEGQTTDVCMAHLSAAELLSPQTGNCCTPRCFADAGSDCSATRRQLHTCSDKPLCHLADLVAPSCSCWFNPDCLIIINKLPANHKHNNQVSCYTPSEGIQLHCNHEAHRTGLVK